jgi:hypothetical protein
VCVKLKKRKLLNLVVQISSNANNTNSNNTNSNSDPLKSSRGIKKSTIGMGPYNFVHSYTLNTAFKTSYQLNLAIISRISQSVCLRSNLAKELGYRINRLKGACKRV